MPLTASSRALAIGRLRRVGVDFMANKPRRAVRLSKNMCGIVNSVSIVSVRLLARTFSKKLVHMKKSHPGADMKLHSVRTTLPTIEVADLPWENRCWTCSKCLLGLATALPLSQRERRSIGAHLDQRAKITPKANLEKLKQMRLEGFRKNKRNQSGWRNAAWRQKRLQEATAKGHDLIFIGSNATGNLQR